MTEVRQEKARTESLSEIRIEIMHKMTSEYGATSDCA